MQIGSSVTIPSGAQANGIQTQFPKTSGASDILVREAETMERERQARPSSVSAPTPASMRGGSNPSGVGRLLDVTA